MSSAACYCAATSPSTPRVPHSSPTPSRWRSTPVRLPGRRAGAACSSLATASRCSDTAAQTVPSWAAMVPGCHCQIPSQFFLHGGVQVLYPSEIATWLTLRFLALAVPPQS